tara:strand:+ start:3298 stop:3774 length:477 start_codon:yes stop_codon:yes gene_type:complete
MSSQQSISELLAAVQSGINQPELLSEWLEIDHERVLAFADATNDHQWIHTDEIRAAESPYGGTIAHGFLTLSLISFFTAGALQFDNTAAVLNYGLDRVRFLSPVRVGSRLRTSSRVIAAEEKTAGILIRLEVTIQIEGEEKPAAVAEQLVLAIAESTL